MNITLLTIGKTDSANIEEIMEVYQKRLSHYTRLSMVTLPDVKRAKSLTVAQRKESEAEALLAQVAPSDYVAILDERGAQLSSMEFATWIEKRRVSGVKRVVFIIGGAFGFAERVYQRADAKISLSRMTFTHQFIRAIFLEQLYRAFTILCNEPYHNE